MVTSKNHSRLLTISISLGCNLDCVYCYEKKSNKRFDVDESVELLASALKTKTTKGTIIKLHGGEPFLIFSEIKHLCESLWDMGFEEEFVFHTTTNGTLIHGEIQEWLSEHREQFIVKLSIDGDSYSQNINRSNSFELIDIPFFINTWPDIKAKMTITHDTIPFLAHNIIFLHNMGFRDIVSSFAFLQDWGTEDRKKIFYQQLLILSAFYQNNPKLIPCSLLRHPLELVLLDDYNQVPCTIGKKVVYDFETRQCYPCHLFFPSVTGRSLPSKIAKLDFSKRSNIEKSDCLKCEIVNICYTCYADNYIVRGAPSNRDMKICPYNQISILVTCKLEFNKIITKDQPSTKDYLKMKAIKKILCTLSEVENKLL